MGIKVLFIYPNTFGMNMLPPAIAIFSSILKSKGHKIQIFDTTYYAVDFNIDTHGSKTVKHTTSTGEKSKMDNLHVLPFDMGKRGIKLKTTDWKNDFEKQLEEFRPDLIAISSTEDMWELGMQILEEAKNYKIKNNIPVLAGGVFPTFAPEICIKEELVDLVCVGEGENALIDLCSKIENNEDYSDVTNLWIKKNGKLIKKNIISKPVNINSSPRIDISLFEENRLYKPMSGKIYKMFPVETIRGCPYRCRYCNSPSQIEFYNKETNGGFFRKKSMKLVYDELKYFKEKHQVEYNYFWADTFLAMNKREFDEFCEMYSDIKLPFWIQTRPETVNDYNIKKLAEVGLHRMAFGIEHGNEKFRREVLDRQWNNENIIERLTIPHKYGVEFSLTNITGLPTETKKLAFDTIELNRQIDADNYICSTFMPFHGTPLRKMCEDLGYIKPGTITKSLYSEQSMLNMPQFTPDEIEGIRKCFVLYIKFPKNRWKEIKKAEKNDEEGRKNYEKLKKEYLETYLPKPDTDPHAQVV
jgi:radical SAM superfamily enzyme YgiQ (UPF0313 family)